MVGRPAFSTLKIECAQAILDTLEALRSFHLTVQVTGNGIVTSSSTSYRPSASIHTPRQLHVSFACRSPLLSSPGPLFWGALPSSFRRQYSSRILSNSFCGAPAEASPGLADCVCCRCRACQQVVPHGGPRRALRWSHGELTAIKERILRHFHRKVGGFDGARQMMLRLHRPWWVR